jgi:hypothetical protein
MRWLFYLVVLLCVAVWRFLPRPWHPAVVIETAHYHICSTATPEQITNTATALEHLYSACSNTFGGTTNWQGNHPRLQIRLFKNREEMRYINPGLGWVEAFYSEPCCQAYYAGQGSWFKAEVDWWNLRPSSAPWNRCRRNGMRMCGA